MKKILIFSMAYYPKYVGGAEVAIKEITDRIKPSDIEFHMVTLRYDSTLPAVEKIGNVLVYRIGFSRLNPTSEDLKKWPLHLNKYLFQFLAYWKAHTLHLTNQYDGVWAMMAHATAVPTALFNLSHPRVPFVLTLQEGDDLNYIEKLARPVWPLFKRAFIKASIIQAISSYLAHWAEKMEAVCPILVVPNGVDVKTFKNTYSKSELQILRSKNGLGLQPDTVVLITTSRLVSKNGIDDVLRALQKLPQEVHFLVLGSGPEEMVLRSLAEELGVASRVVFKGYVAYNELPKYLSASDIFVRPSRTEGMGNSFIEAMAAGLPVVATQEGGLRDFIFGTVQNPEKPTTAWVVPKDNPSAIAEAVTRILLEPATVLKVTENAQKVVSGTYEWDTVASRMAGEVFLKLTSH